MKRLSSLSLISIICIFTILPAYAKADTEPYILLIDSLLTRQKDFEIAKLQRIDDLKEKRSQARSVEELFALNENLTDEYSTYRADSALEYIEYNLRIADDENNPAWKARTLLSKASLLSGTGLLNEAHAALKQINSGLLTDDIRMDYYGQMMYLYNHLGNYARGGNTSNQYYARERAYKDSIMSIIDPSHPDFLWYKGWYVLGRDKNDNTVIPALKKKLESAQFNSRQDAKNAYILSRLYKYKGDTENAKKYMALSAIADIRTANAEIASMKELAEFLFKENDIDRAYRYINYSLEQAKAFPNRVRIVGHIDSIDRINKAYQEKTLRQENRIRITLILVCILALVLIATIVIIIKQNGKLKRQGHNLDETNKTLNVHINNLSSARSQLAEANRKLKELNTDLTNKNDELHEANYVKEEYIGYVFTLCSDNIRKLDNLRKGIHTKAVAGKLKDIERLTSSNTIMKDELKEFYHSFDTIFLHIYPDFVKDFNELLQEGKEIVPKEGELLNTELRIYALVRLGITDSVKIAEFLHCSPQTVYNNRFRVRNKARVPKEKFAETVRTLGKFVDQAL